MHFTCYKGVKHKHAHGVVRVDTWLLCGPFLNSESSEKFIDFTIMFFFSLNTFLVRRIVPILTNVTSKIDI